jgi:hypothetical protein
MKFRDVTPKVHFSGFSLMLKRLRLVKVYSRSRMRLSPHRVFMMVSLTETSRLCPIYSLKYDCMNR